MQPKTIWKGTEMRVLILHPDPRIVGGVQLYFQKISGRFNMHVDHFIVGKRPEEKHLLEKARRLIFDYARFLSELKTGNYDVVHVNPALDFNMFFRDGFFHYLAKRKNKKTVVFFRGWQKSFESKIERYGLWIFKLLFQGANAFIVLSEDFKDVLLSWNCSKPILREVTIIDDDMLSDFDVQDTIDTRLTRSRWRILFLARIVREKGLYETIEAFEILTRKYPECELIIAGEGDESDNARAFVHQRSIGNVSFPGFVKGRDKTDLMKSAHLLCLPTSYGEGLPNSITEAMAFGLPVVTRPVGGIADFFKNGEHGFATLSRDPEMISNFMETILVDKPLYRKISMNNYQYAGSNFLASSAAERLERIYRSLA